MTRRRQPPRETIFVHPLSVVRAERGWTYQDLVNVIARRVGNMAARRRLDAHDAALVPGR